MNFISKAFSELSATELYEIIKSRTEIFLLEQKIICQDLDDMDYSSLHCFYTDGKRVTAYMRAFPSNEDKFAVMIGRVLTLEHKKGLGSELMKRGMEEAKKYFKRDKICIHAQKQAEGFYKKLGFKTVSDVFMEEGVAHVIMETDVP